MKTAQHQSSAHLSFPIDLVAYDRRGTFLPEEMIVLASFMELRTAGKQVQWYPGRVPELEWIIQPMLDVFRLIDGPPQTQRQRDTIRWAVTILLREMYRRQTPLWAWTQTEWEETLCASNKVFMQHYRFHSSTRTRLLKVAYILGNFCNFEQMGIYRLTEFASKVFGQIAVDRAVQPIWTQLKQMGYGETTLEGISCGVCELLLANRSCVLEALTLDVLREVHHRLTIGSRTIKHIHAISRVLAHMGIIEKPLPPDTRWRATQVDEKATRGIAPEWAAICKRWRATTTLQPKTVRQVYYQMLRVGRWLNEAHPEIVEPSQWTRELAAEYIATVNQMTVGMYSSGLTGGSATKVGKPLQAATKEGMFGSARMFFRELQEWEWIPRRFDVGRALATPASVRKLIGPNPRAIADDIWTKLLTAGLNLQSSDFPTPTYGKGGVPTTAYPLSMIQAIVVVWLFAGLRRNEIRRLRLSCVRWQREEQAAEGTEIAQKPAICLLDVPVNKTGTAFTKPVDRVVGEAIALWEKDRPPQPAMLDSKTGEHVQFLFAYRGKQIGEDFLNNTVIPALCRKSGVPEQDARGDITSHRARSTIASQLFNAKEPMSLFELQAWLGHRSPHTTQFYAKVTPTKLARAYAEADYFKRNVRTITVLIDRESIRSGATARGAPWRYFDLGHGYCSYEFFEQCPHRMACAKCPFYLPKDSTQVLMKEAQGNLVRMKQEMELSDEEIAAIDEGVHLMEQLVSRLADIPTPAGPTPRQLKDS